MKPAMHGERIFSFENNLLIVEGEGPWNLDAILHIPVAAQRGLESLFNKTWAVLVIIKGDSMCVPEARLKLIEFIREDRLKGRVATAFIIKQCSVPLLVESHFKDIYTTAGDKYQHFTEHQESEAKAWLALQVKQQQVIAAV
ncbi:MAG: hypothetical protein HRU05_03655 [Oceanospirillaceae bacterium]|nr:hypothetical protein [Oceanospirillaceae bacterium]